MIESLKKTVQKLLFYNLLYSREWEKSLVLVLLQLPPGSAEGWWRGVFVGRQAIGVGAAAAAALLLRGRGPDGVVDLDPGRRRRLEALRGEVMPHVGA